MEISVDLHKKCFPEEVVERTIEELLERGWLDDEALARKIVINGQKAGKSWPKIYADLRKRGVERNLAEACLRSTYDPVREIQNVRQLLSKALASCPSSPTQDDIERIAKKLARRGFRASTIAKALQEAASDSCEQSCPGFLDTGT